MTVLGGALGAGKTTVVNSILRQARGRRIAVIVNDFGAIDIDADLIVGRTERTVSLDNGCICCSLQGDLVSAILETLATGRAPDAFVVEASGVANPRTVAGVIQRLQGHQPVRLDSVLVVADAERMMHRVNEAEQAFTLEQLRGANSVLMTKRDLVDAETYLQATAAVTEVVPGVRLLHAVNGQVSIDLLLDTGLADDLMDRPLDVQERMFSVDTWSFESVHPFDVERLKTAVWRLPVGIVRAKGIIRLGDVQARSVVFQLVGRRATLTPLPESEGGGTSRLVVIGVQGSVNPVELEQLFTAALIEP